MSLRKKLEQAATFAAKDAVQSERGRVLWILNEIEREIKAGVQKKLVIESKRHAMQVKLSIFTALKSRVVRAIVSGMAPGPVVEQETSEQKAARIAREICEEDPDDEQP